MGTHKSALSTWTVGRWHLSARAGQSEREIGSLTFVFSLQNGDVISQSLINGPYLDKLPKNATSLMLSSTSLAKNSGRPTGRKNSQFRPKIAILPNFGVGLNRKSSVGVPLISDTVLSMGSTYRMKRM